MPADSPISTPFTAQQLFGRSLNEVEAKHAPAFLFAAGARALLRTSPRVSMVGARKASSAALTLARDLATWLVGHDVIVVSGLAEGIDTAAHRATIAAHGRTIAVLGTPLEEFYPAKNRALQLEIMRDHLALSQFASGMPTRPAHFPMRNRTMALVSDATVMVEASENSGSLHQGWEALRLGRPLFIMSAQIDDPALTWPRQMLHYGAQPLAAGEWDPVLDALPERARDDAIPLTL